MEYIDYKEMLATARNNFIAGRYELAEPLLKQMLLLNNQEPEVYQMLATIFYDKGKFNKAIKTFKRALEVDPNYTDASIGLSIILNDLGRYDEGKDIFQEAKSLLDKRNSRIDLQAKETLARKHIDLANMYEQYQQYSEAIDQYYKALNLTNKKESVILSITDCYIADSNAKIAVKELKKFLQQYPQANSCRMKLGIVYYNANKILDAIQQWEAVLTNDPQHEEAKNFLSLAQKTGVTELSENNL